MCGDSSEELNPDDVLWTPGVDYVGGWRDAKGAGGELAAVLSAVWSDAQGIRAVALSASDGSGLVQLRLPTATARTLAAILRAVAAGTDAARPAS